MAIYTLQFTLVISAYLLRFHSEWTLLLIYLAFSGSVLYGFYLTDKIGWTLPRYDLLDSLIGGNLSILNKRQLLIKICYSMLEVERPCCCLSAAF